MVHQPHGGAQGQATDIMIHAEEIIRMKSLLYDIYAKHTGQPLPVIRTAFSFLKTTMMAMMTTMMMMMTGDLLERDKFLSPKEAQALGLIDRVVERPGPEDEGQK